VTGSIFPYDPSANAELSNLIEVLELFWGADKSAAWRRLCQDGSITQSAKNHIAMNRQLRLWLDNAKCALKPLRQTQNEIVVQWHWLRGSTLRPRTEIREDLDMLEQAGLADQGWGANLAHTSSGISVPIKTGQTFVIRAEDPEHLPSFELLELQWNLLRVAAICGAAEATEEDYKDHFDDRYDGDEDSNYGY
jgi:hypothetical protein